MGNHHVAFTCMELEGVVDSMRRQQKELPGFKSPLRNDYVIPTCQISKSMRQKKQELIVGPPPQYHQTSTHGEDNYIDHMPNWMTNLDESRYTYSR